MTPRGTFVLAAIAIVAALVLAVIASGALSSRPVALTSPPAQTPASTASVTASASHSPSPASAVITGRLGYPSDFIPPLTIYAVSVTDPHTFFSTNTPRYGNDPSAPPTPGAPIPPYALSVTPGTYYVYGLRNDLGGGVIGPGAVVYSSYTVKCQQASPSPTGPCQQSHDPLPVTVRAGETVDRIDLTDWFCNTPGSTCPPRPQ